MSEQEQEVEQSVVNRVYLVGVKYVVHAPDPLMAQIMVQRDEGIDLPVEMTAEQIDPGGTST